MKNALHAEWTKQRSLSGTAWLLFALVAATVVVGAATSGSIDTSRCPSPAQCLEDTTKLTFTGVWFGQVAAVVLAGLTMTSEYSTKMIHTTLASNPRRIQVLTAKAVVMGTLVVTAGTLAALGSLIVGGLVLHGSGFTAANGYPVMSLADEPTLEPLLAPSSISDLLRFSRSGWRPSSGIRPGQ